MRSAMKCNEMQGMLPDLAAGLTEPSAAAREHLRGCADCAAKLEKFRKTMALMDEWEAPEPSAYFDTRLAARLREEKAAEASRSTGWLAWLPRPVVAMAAVLVLAVGVGVWQHGGPRPEKIAVVTPAVVQPERGTAVGDLQTLDSDNDLYADFDVLDDIDSQQNPPTASN